MGGVVASRCVRTLSRRAGSRTRWLESFAARGKAPRAAVVSAHDGRTVEAGRAAWASCLIPTEQESVRAARPNAPVHVWYSLRRSEFANAWLCVVLPKPARVRARIVAW
jgi:hypothetical protein